MSELSADAIRTNLAALAAPPDWPGAAAAARLCALQQTLTPVTAPRRLVLFAADHGPGEDTVIGPAIREVVSGAAATAVLAKHLHCELALVDVGSLCHPQRETANYRCRKVRSRSSDAALSADEFRAAFVVGQKEADDAAKDGARVVATDALGPTSAPVALATRARLARATDADPIPALAPVSGPDVAAAAGFIARGAELGLAVVISGPFAEAAAEVAERLYPGTRAKCIQPPPPGPPSLKGGGENEPARASNAHDAREATREFSPPPFREGGAGGGGCLSSDGMGALLAIQALDAAAAVIANTARRVRGRDQVVSIKRRKIAVFTGSFDPPTTFHRRAAKLLRGRGFDEVIVRPNGPKCDGAGEHAAPIHRAVMVDQAFRDLPGVTVDLSDLDDQVFTPPVAFADLFAERGEVWHVVSDEFLTDGRAGKSWVHTKWECGADVWRGGRFAVLHPSECAPDPRDRPPVCELFEADGHVPTADIRTRVFQGGPARPDVPPAVEAYMRRYGLFSGRPSPREARVRLSDVRLKIVYDERNDKARAFADKFRRYETSDPTHVLALGGDGTMLHAIREHWRLRLPFIGLNAGTLGFVMNESLPDELEGAELVLYRMPMLRVDTETPDGTRASALAVADAWVERDSGQAAWLRVDVDGRTQVPRVVGDGLLVATPCGSSAYARAMGATPVPLTAPVLTLAGSNVFRPRFWRPVTMPEDARVSLTSLDHNGKRPVRGYIDGRPVGAVRAMDVRVSTVAAVELAFTPEFDLSARLLRSMFPPTDGVL